MKKMSLINPQGRIGFHTYIADKDGCGHIRVIFPSLLLNQFKYEKLYFDSTYNSYFIDDANFYKSISIVKFQRSITQGQLECIEKCKYIAENYTGHGILYEVDDLLTPDIPDTNFSAKYYKESWPIIQQILKKVNGITVSTKKLKDELIKYNSNISVIKNRLVPSLWHQKFPKKNKEEKIKILWAGSQNHFNVNGAGGDFNNELLNFIKKTCKKIDWIFVGAFPNELKNTDIIKYKWQKILDFGKFISDLDVDIGIAPLEDNIFNRCKSNIKALEFASLGIPGVYSDIEPYKNMTFASNNNFIDNIEKLINDFDLRQEIWNKDYNLLKNDLYWDDKSLKYYINSHLELFNKKIQ